MILSLIGMSNAGKSHWAKRLEAQQGFVRFCCDDLIANELQTQHPHRCLEDVDDLAAWMGMPHDPGYREREAAYLEAEQSVLESVLASPPLLEGMGVVTRDMVIDTTGSVIYLSKDLLDRLRRVSTVIYLSTSDHYLADMTEEFFSTPKPLVWGQVLTLHSGESHEAALLRCYPELLRWRQARYEALADVTIPHEKRRHGSYSTDDFLHDVLQYQQQDSSC